ncbi:MAG: DNA gyrase inhibitor YacG [Candidatus Omnitrophota bacterium]|nr:MAG: DNA gyrase inhibitor YacG [Candidatus Omnitrophota bacterium]
MPDNEQRCRTCGKLLPEGRAAPTFPFCCRRCKMADLGRWFSGDYCISEPLPLPEIDLAAETEPGPK